MDSWPSRAEGPQEPAGLLLSGWTEAERGEAESERHPLPRPPVQAALLPCAHRWSPNGPRQCWCLNFSFEPGAQAPGRHQGLFLGADHPSPQLPFTVGHLRQPHAAFQAFASHAHGSSSRGFCTLCLPGEERVQGA